jgi:hypothetical protein
VSGYYSQTTEGINDIYTVSSGKWYPDATVESPWRTGNLKGNNAELPAGTKVKFKISLAKMVVGGVTTETLGKPEWTVEVETTIQPQQ